jgi:hypothetical protein
VTEPRTGGPVAVAHPEPSLRGDVVLCWHGPKRIGGASVYVWQGVLDELVRSAQWDPAATRIGLLTGRFHDGRIDGWLRWDGFAEIASYGSVDAFVDELRSDWELIRNRVRRADGDVDLIGWVVSAPGSDARLAPIHAMVHRTFFNLPWQLTVIIDPASQRLALYGTDAEGDLVNPGFCTVRRRSDVIAPLAPSTQETS